MQALIEDQMADKLRFLYGNDDTLVGLMRLIAEYPIPPRSVPLDQGTALLIAYGDHLHDAGQTPLQALRQFADDHLRDMVSGVHILPFFPYTSDDGFSVSDYLAVNPALGTWDDVKALGDDFRLMFDLVLNHISKSHAWFQGFLRDEKPYRDYIMTASPDVDLTAVVRPRTHPLLTPFDTADGKRYVWTTFSTDQVDLNFGNPAVLLEIIKTLLIYVQNGADYIRLDAVAYMWKIPGTTSIHLEQTHCVIQLMRDVLNVAAPWVKIITETNVPHAENLSYFGDGHNEAQLVYQFALPPLLLHTFYSGDARALSDWAATLETPSPTTTFFNFTASHDGVGIRPATGLISDEAIQHIYDTVQARGGQISYKANSDGTQSAYEMNITYFDALADPGEPLEVSVNRFICSQAIMLGLAGVPGIYLGSLFGSANWQEGMAETGRARTINREKFDLPTLEAALNDSTTRYGQVFQRYSELLRIRREQKAFDPATTQKVVNLGESIFAVKRGDLLAVYNVSDRENLVELDGKLWHDVIEGKDRQELNLRPYQFAWLIPG